MECLTLEQLVNHRFIKPYTYVLSDFGIQFINKDGNNFMHASRTTFGKISSDINLGDDNDYQAFQILCMYAFTPLEER